MKTFNTAENRHVQISCWKYFYRNDTLCKDDNNDNQHAISREMCLVMNELARIISDVNDDWWK